MIPVVVKQNKNEKMSGAYGLYYAYPVVNETYDLNKLSEHMASHNTPFSAGAIKGMLTDAVSCIRELNLQGIAVKIDNLAIFSIGIKNKVGAKSEEEWSVAKNVEGVKLRARATGDLLSSSLKLDATIKKVSLVSGSTSGGTGGGSSTTPGGGSTPDPGDSNPGGGSQTGGSQTGGSEDANPGGGSSTGDGGDVGL